MKTAILFLFFTVFSGISFAQNQYLLLNQGMPVLTESALTLEQNEFQWGLGGSSRRSHTTGFGQVNYGILSNLEAFVNIGTYSGYSRSSDNFIDRIDAGLKYNINPGSKIFPLISFSAKYMPEFFGTDKILLKAIATKSFGNVRTHLNLSNYFNEGWNERTFDAGGAIDYNFPNQKLLLVGEIVAHNFSNLEYSYHIGAKKQIGDSFVIYGGIGAMVSETISPRKNISLGINWYGFDWLGDLQ
ncbi:MAG TPA: hypothetical protein VHP32_01550 [Ignavibacteria bacterium]|nr:hypothetical protein [Ignavibacteria bacterium]